jgi:murein L,D-transpeptidase YafK
MRRSLSILIVFLFGAAALVSLALWNDDAARKSLTSALVRTVPPLRPYLDPFFGKPIANRLSAAGFSIGQPVLIRVFKEDSLLEVWMQRGAVYEKFADYPICKWSGALGPKIREGDRQSPEGYYAVSDKQLLPTSRHHRAINTGFPNAFDAGLGRTGTVLMIHGSCSSIGCYAMTDPGIDDIYTMIEAALERGNGPVNLHLYPFRLTEGNLRRHGQSPWISYWRNLAEGDRLFRATGRPPEPYACQGRYVFGSAAQTCRKIAAW